jgi:hypothetical protein
MPEFLERGQRLRNGKDGPQLPIGAIKALGNTEPRATLGSTFGTDVPVPTRETFVAESELLPVHTIVVQAAGEPIWTVSLPASSLKGSLRYQIQEMAFKPTGQVVLFRKIMEQWAFSDDEASTLLGFEDAADIRDIYDGRKPVGQRDANDRLRVVLRIAADVDALFQDEKAIRDWLSETQKDLGGQTPRALLNEGSMENLLKVKYYVSYLSGR